MDQELKQMLEVMLHEFAEMRREFVEIRRDFADLRQENAAAHAETRKYVDTSLADMRQENAAAFDAMRQENAAAFDAMRQENAAAFDAMRQENAAAFEAIRQENAAAHAETRKYVDSSLADMRQENAAAHAETRKYVDASHAETRHLFTVTAESLRAEIRLVAEGVAAVDEKLDRETADIRTEMRQGFADLRSMITLSHDELDRRIRALEEPDTPPH